MLLAFLVGPAVALRDCPLDGLEGADACGCCDEGEAEPVVSRASCCEGDLALADVSAGVLSGEDKGAWIVAAAWPREMPLAPRAESVVHARCRGPPSGAGPPLFIRNQSLLL